MQAWRKQEHGEAPFLNELYPKEIIYGEVIVTPLVFGTNSPRLHEYIHTAGEILIPINELSGE